MIEDSRKLERGQTLKVILNKVGDRLPQKVFDKLSEEPHGKLIGFKMVDGNQFGLVIELRIGITLWFFEDELSEVANDSQAEY